MQTRVLVTGGTGGIGFETAVALAKAGAEVVVAGRAKTKVDHAVAAVRDAVGTAKVEGLVLDLASLASIDSAAAEVLATGQPLDLLINNAGIMAVPGAPGDRRRVRADVRDQPPRALRADRAPAAGPAGRARGPGRDGQRESGAGQRGRRSRTR